MPSEQQKIDYTELSLDQIIKLKKGEGNKKNRGGNKQQQHKPNLQRLRNLGARSGIVRRGGPRQTNQRQQQQTSPRNELTMLHISNLHYSVSNNDIKELFSAVGNVRKAAVHYDKSSRSLGTAEVIFVSRDAAIRAIKKYHNVPLDGRQMSITMVPNQNRVRSPAKSRIGVKPGSGIYKRPQIKGNRGGPTNKGHTANNRGNKPKFQPRGNKREPKKAITAEQLDADLEAYSMTVD